MEVIMEGFHLKVVVVVLVISGVWLLLSLLRTASLPIRRASKPQKLANVGRDKALAYPIWCLVTAVQIEPGQFGSVLVTFRGQDEVPLTLKLVRGHPSYYVARHLKAWDVIRLIYFHTGVDESLPPDEASTYLAIEVRD